MTTIENIYLGSKSGTNVDAQTFPQLSSKTQQVDFWRKGKLLNQFAEVHDRDALEISQFVARFF
jgi:hypothetical protein